MTGLCRASGSEPEILTKMQQVRRNHSQGLSELVRGTGAKHAKGTNRCFFSSFLFFFSFFKLWNNYYLWLFYKVREIKTRHILERCFLSYFIQ